MTTATATQLDAKIITWAFLFIRFGKEKNKNNRFKTWLKRFGFNKNDKMNGAYSRHFATEHAALSYVESVSENLPTDCIMTTHLITDEQFGKMRVRYGKK